MNSLGETAPTTHVPQRFGRKWMVGRLLLVLVGGFVAWIGYQELDVQRQQNESSPISWSQAALPSEILGIDISIPSQEFILDPAVGLRNPGKVQKVERIVIRLGQTAAMALMGRGIKAEDATAVIDAMKHVFDFRRLKAADTFVARLDEHQRLISLDLVRSPLEQWHARAGLNGFVAERKVVAVDTVLAEVAGQIQTSVWDALVTAGEDPALVQELVDIFAYVIDFYTELRPGDAFYVLVEKRYAQGQFVGYGQITAAEFHTGPTAHHAFAFRHDDGHLAYYDREGKSLRKQLLRAPLRYAPVTSRFGNRRHPVLGYTRQHNGIDYGVPSGTPVWSVADGRVVRAGMAPGFGKLVEISHPNGWLSQYAHLSRIMVRVGDRVRQKDIVGLVGATGLATGPHLHYGLKHHGSYVNPLRQKFERARSLGVAEMDAFQTQIAGALAHLERIRLAKGHLAQKLMR